MNKNTQLFLDHTGIEIPLICGAMYPCSNPELIAAVSKAGGIGIIQPISMQYVHGHDLREGIRYMKTLTDKPVGFNAIVEKSSDIYMNRMKKWIDIALEEGVRFFITALGNPRFVVEKVHAVGGIVYHDVTERKWAQKALESGVDGLICVNSNAGGHAGALNPKELYDSMGDLGVPLVCAGGVGDETQFMEMINIGYGGVQLGTRFIATEECKAHNDYKKAICDAKPEDIVLTERISGVPVAIIKTPFIEKTGTEAGWFMKKVLRHRKFKHYGRMYYSIKSLFELKKASLQGMNYKDFFQAGKSVSGIHKIEYARDVVKKFADVYQSH